MGIIVFKSAGMVKILFPQSKCWGKRNAAERNLSALLFRLKNLYICKIVKKNNPSSSSLSRRSHNYKAESFFFNLQKIFSFIDLTLDILFKKLLLLNYVGVIWTTYEWGRSLSGGLAVEFMKIQNVCPPAHSPNSPVGWIGVFAGPVLAPGPYVWPPWLKTSQGD